MRALQIVRSVWRARRGANPAGWRRRRVVIASTRRQQQQQQQQHRRPHLSITCCRVYDSPARNRRINLTRLQTRRCRRLGKIVKVYHCQWKIVDLIAHCCKASNALLSEKFPACSYFTPTRSNVCVILACSYIMVKALLSQNILLYYCFHTCQAIENVLINFITTAL